jgi:hypothetical protein
VISITPNATVFWFHSLLCFFVVAIIRLIIGVTNSRPGVLTPSWDSAGNFCGNDNTKIASEVKNLDNFTLCNLESIFLLFFGSDHRDDSVSFE